MHRKNRLLLNGKVSSQPFVREAVQNVRKIDPKLEVRVTYEYGDIARMVSEAVNEEVGRIIAGGGDGTLNEAVNALMGIEKERRPELGIVPLGTANDFAVSCGISMLAEESLKMAVEFPVYEVDVGKANERYFLNVASGGFGAVVTSQTPPELKSLLGGSAYALTGLMKLLSFTPHRGRMRIGNMELSGATLAAAVCNGRRSGGGQMLAPKAFIDDGLLDIVLLEPFSPIDIPQLLEDFQNPSENGKFYKYFQAERVDVYSDEEYRPINLDGEPYDSLDISFSIMKKALNIVLPRECPLLSRMERQ